MRHAVFGRRLGRDTNARAALLKSLAASLVERGKITTTLAKAKWVRPYMEKMITKAQKNRLSAKRELASDFESRAFLRLVNEVAVDRNNGGYTKLTRLAPRHSDGAVMARLEFTKSKVQPEKKIEKPPTLKSKTNEKPKA